MLMEFFIFDFNSDINLINSFLDSCSIAHKQDKKSSEWFFWKFKNNPFGESILACAKDKGQIIGCVAYGIQNFRLNDETIKGAISFETFVHPEYQNMGLFSKLLVVAEKEVVKRNICFLLNFPNSKSLKGFLNKDWKAINSAEYWIRPVNTYRFLINARQVRNPLKNLPSNLSLLEFIKDFSHNNQNSFETQITQNYLKWRFFSFPVSRYFVESNDNFDLVARIGNRGRLLEGQVLYVNIKNKNKFKFSRIIASIARTEKIDLISFSVSRNNIIRKSLKKSFFVKVPSNINVCYKILNGTINDSNIEELSFSAINYHTY